MSAPDSPSDDLNRDAFYSADSIEPDDGDDYELEPPDPDVITAEQRLTAERIAAAARSLDDDEIMREDQRRIDGQFVSELLSNFRFQFQIKHLLWATGVVAVLVAVAQYSWPASVMLAVLASVGGTLTFLSWKEKQHEAFMAERRRQFSQPRPLVGGAPDAASPDAQPTPESAAPSPPPSFTQQLLTVCSPKELLAASIAAVVLIALLSYLLGTAMLALCLGIFALVGIVLQAVGVDMPRQMALGWWLMLVLYIVVSVILAVSGGS